MKVSFHKNYKKRYRKLKLNQKKQVDDALDKFIRDPCDKTLYNHALKGTMKGMRAISAGFDLRIVFYQHDDYVEVLFLSVGTHNQVY